ncbi:MULTISPECIES: carboxymuconolactone decarboxylase family protein [Dietzia]|jgi:AhpD family alkylhydroperoxidase|uniref:Carboxymuconolactone decarboxylase family protein n=1 Tax=Dietzia maris TaxID=37915 RepID=A0A365PBQ3_9ACTN|nr:MULTISPECIES: carboxymuconolactone decarboxylase family protein [Dietzia]MBC7307905.1 carboxymuconolactone decarboxylase family protein [Dietzia sp.]ODQ85449.1 alkylhydroperoxidase [Dietzia alimentaria]MBB0998369.1 carboxymuconolactone decarboxylase family protein [Dietzia maris]MCZ4539345.1 carboxymuconolactone decarboxylase family protein [Dietzia maris]MCZ4657250.1 carboxymuconolactone decarboxylase family protein [Dietzia kunjamensis]
MGVPQLDRTQREVYKRFVRTAVASREASGEAGLEESLLELVNVRVSQLNGCAACLATHVPAARKAGVSQDRLDLLPAWREIDAFGDQERAALRLAETLTRLDDAEERAAAIAAAADHFSDEQLSALEWTIVLINAFNRVSIASHHQPAIED